MQKSTFSFGKLPNLDAEKMSNSITICLTEECSLRCRYYYHAKCYFQLHNRLKASVVAQKSASRESQTSSKYYISTYLFNSYIPKVYNTIFQIH